MLNLQVVLGMFVWTVNFLSAQKVDNIQASKHSVIFIHEDLV